MGSGENGFATWSEQDGELCPSSAPAMLGSCPGPFLRVWGKCAWAIGIASVTVESRGRRPSGWIAYRDGSYLALIGLGTVSGEEWHTRAVWGGLFPGKSRTRRVWLPVWARKGEGGQLSGGWLDSVDGRCGRGFGGSSVWEDMGERVRPRKSTGMRRVEWSFEDGDDISAVA